MQLATIPTPVIAANQRVLGDLASASKLTRQAQVSFEHDGVGKTVKTSLEQALGHAQDAAKGVDELGSKLLLDGTFQRYAGHSVRDLAAAVAMLDRPGQLSADGTKIFADKLFDAEVATRLGTEAGERSMSRPALRGRETSSQGGGGDAGSNDGGPTWVDGAWLDELGNPARGGDEWAGPDGERFGSDGSPSDSGGTWVGPDGEGYSGI